MNRIKTSLDCRWLTNRGPMVREFEQMLSAYLGVKHCITMANGTIALEIAIRALDLHGEVILPSMTFIATAHALQWQQIKPVFCDIDPRTLTIDPAAIEQYITPFTTGIIGVHLWGRTCAVARLSAIAEKYNLRLIFDAAHSLGCSAGGQLIGSFGDAEVFSLHATKFVNSFEGGVVATNNDQLAEKMRLMQNFGFQGLDNVVYVGTNGKMNEISAAMGITSLESIDAFIETNRKNFNLYRNRLNRLNGITVRDYDKNEKSNYQYVIVEIDTHKTGLTRDDLMRLLHAENILARRYFYPGCHRMEPYKTLYPHAGLLLFETERLVDRILVLPTGTGIQPNHIDAICTIIETALKHPLYLKTKIQHSPYAEKPVVYQRSFPQLYQSKTNE
jgi:dTDP-4-amino-4,6-dideoxygalactose transaminase